MVKRSTVSILSLSPRRAWFALGFCVLVLVALGLSADVVITRHTESTGWVTHTREVETSISTAHAHLLDANAARLSYIVTGDESSLQQYNAAIQNLHGEINHLQFLTSDNPSEQQRIDHLNGLIDQTWHAMERSVALRRSGFLDQQQQIPLSKASTDLVAQSTAVLGDMRNEEEALLTQRRTISNGQFRHIQIVIRLIFLFILLLLAATIHSLWAEIRDRQLAEAAIRRLNSRILEMQDAERRKVARELHDSIGQYFAALVMQLSLCKRDESLPENIKKSIVECIDIVEKGIAETRTLSHLLHPPMLDEAGFASAAQWYVDGFNERSGIGVKMVLPKNVTLRLPREAELVLFRVLQESLTNIHKHSGSTTAEARLDVEPSQVKLTVKDNGRGIPPDLLAKFERSGTGAGVGLAGMRERVHDLGGQFEISSNGKGTELRVILPLVPEMLPLGAAVDTFTSTTSSAASSSPSPSSPA
jgi:signal transduction histidine kinase